ncbi:UNVERIFIED_ORG: hypothetical protein BCL66_101441 [Martelella mediterranea]
MVNGTLTVIDFGVTCSRNDLPAYPLDLIYRFANVNIMPVLITADLHLDQWLGEGRDPFAALPPETFGTLDALIIAGDLADKPKIRWPRMLQHLRRHIDSLSS